MLRVFDKFGGLSGFLAAERKSFRLKKIAGFADAPSLSS
jgi:hypothetical protein